MGKGMPRQDDRGARHRSSRKRRERKADTTARKARVNRVTSTVHASCESRDLMRGHHPSYRVEVSLSSS